MLIDLDGLRCAYELRKISKFIWVLPLFNPAYVRTKQGKYAALKRLIEVNLLERSPKAWVERRRDIRESVNNERSPEVILGNNDSTESLN